MLVLNISVDTVDTMVMPSSHHLIWLYRYPLQIRAQNTQYKDSIIDKTLMTLNSVYNVKIQS